MNFEQVKELIGRIDQSTLTEFELDLGAAHIRMSKNKGSITQMAAAQPRPSVVAQETADHPATLRVPPLHGGALSTLPLDGPVTLLPEEAKPVAEGSFVTSPLVGTFYTRPAPDKPDFAAVGDKVEKGDVLCIVEAMKVMNEITSEVDGEIAEVCAKNEQMVEYGQHLFRII